MNTSGKPSSYPARWDELIGSYLTGGYSPDDLGELEDLLRNHPEFRLRFLETARMDSLLHDWATGQRHCRSRGPADFRLPSATRFRLRHITAIAAALALLATLPIVVSRVWPKNAAEIVSTENVRWLSEAMEGGQGLKPGDEVRLASGSVAVRFQSGALTRIHGPARFEVTSANGSFLHYGQAWTRADTAESKGFTMQTPSGRFIDRGTEFGIAATTDGFSQMHVASGEVDAEVEGGARQRFGKGSGLGIEPGETPVFIRIEPGAETPDFSFPTIPPPSSSDAADLQDGRCAVRLFSRDYLGRVNLPHINSGGPECLIDGRGQTADDRPTESLFFTDGAEGAILLDFGRAIPVARIHTYSWHMKKMLPARRERAVQRYTLWGCGEAKPEAMPDGEQANGWTRIARVDTDVFFRVEEEPDRPAQQACSIHSSAASIGDFRYLLFEANPTTMSGRMPARHTFFAEIDVFEAAPVHIQSKQ